MNSELVCVKPGGDISKLLKPTGWKHYRDDIFSLWDTSKPDIEAFIEQATYITQLLNSQLKYLTLRLCFQTRLYTKAQDSTKNLSLM